MRIEKLHIDGFGVFHAKEIDGFKSGVNVLYGRNEAGKSTLLDFIRFTLFEYPRFLEQRRPPLNGGKHGGTIWLRNQEEEPLSIYRHGNAKEVRFEYKDQRIEDINTYHRMISNASVDLYRNVYAITLDELMQVEQLDDSGMEDRIFSMGMGLSGVNFGMFEAEIKKHSEELFTVRGRTQVLAEITTKIQEKEQTIGELRNKLDDYNRLSEEKNSLQEELKSLKDKRESYGLLVNRDEDLKRAYPSFIEYLEARKIIDQEGQMEFYGLHLAEEFRELKNGLNNEEKEIARIRNKITQLVDKLEGLSWDKDLAKHTYLLDYFKASVKIFEQARTDLVHEEDKRERAHLALKNKSLMLGDSVDTEKLLKLKGSLEIRSKAAKSMDILQSLMRQAESKKETLNSHQNELDRLNIRKTDAEKQRSELEINDQQKKDQYSEKKIVLETEFQRALKNTGGSSATGGNWKLIYLVLGIFLLLGGTLFFVNTTAAIAVITAVVLGSFILLLGSKSGASAAPSKMVDVTSISLEIEKIKNDVKQFEELTSRIKDLDSAIEERKRMIEIVSEEVENIADEIERVKNDWVRLLKENQLPESLEIHEMDAFLSTVEELKRQDTAKKEAEATIEKNKKRITDFENKVKEVFPDISSVDVAFVYALIEKIEKNQKIQEERQRLEEQISDLKEDESQSSNEISILRDQMNKLLAEVNVGDENEFYAHFEKQNQLAEAKSQMDSAEKTIRTICGENKLEKTLEDLGQMTPAELSIKLDETQGLHKKFKHEYDEMNRRLAAVSTEIRHILQPDEMFKLQNEKESLEAQLKEGVKEWLTNKMALRIISESKQKYEEEKQPEVITQTRDYLKDITDNAYEDLRISLSEKHVSVIDKQGKQKSVGELSRGTREQLLLALRMGLIEEYEKSAEPLPVVLDDVMVNFDVHRSRNLAKTLTHFAQKRQVILFTCHEHTKELFREFNANIVEW
ncbi:MAG: AAA family ATPase [Brumimicrobium sp.]|nr:AAA family ATPase [Brumimicrobium sp.]